MNVKDVERAVGITSVNIRFYEKEGLIMPKRNETNNYREYTADDIKRLKQIKFLRVLGVSVSDIRGILAGDYELDEIIEKRQLELEKEAEQLQELKLICGNILKDRMKLDDLDCSILDEKNSTIKKRLEVILSEDTAEIEITRHEYNRLVWKWTVAAFLLDTIICLLCIGFYKDTEILGIGATYPMNPLLESFLSNWFLPLVLILSIFTAFSTVWTAKMWALYMNFILASISFPLLIFAFTFIFRAETWNIAREGAGFFAALAIFVGVFGFCLNKFQRVQKNCLYGACGAIIFSLIFIAWYRTVSRLWVLWAILITGYLLFMTIIWVVDVRIKTSYTKFSAITSAISKVNLLAALISGYGNTKSWRRDGREFR